MSWVHALSEITHVMGEIDACRKAGFTEAALAFPRDELALKMLCAFNGCQPHQAPNGWRYFPNEATKKAWKRVADEATRDHEHTRQRLKELSLDVLAWWKVIFDTDFVHTKPGETPTQLAQRAREELDARRT